MSEGGLTATDYANLEKAVEAASRRFDLKELKRLRRRAMGLVEKEGQAARGEEAIKRIKKQRAASAVKAKEQEREGKKQTIKVKGGVPEPVIEPAQKPAAKRKSTAKVRIPRRTVVEPSVEPGKKSRVVKKTVKK